MADKPILFSGPMVRAQWDGRKTQTRRVVKIPAIMGNKVAVTSPDERLIELEEGEFRRGICHYESTGALSGPYALPYAVGDRLWVREAWHAARSLDRTPPRDIPRDADIEYAATKRSYAEIGLIGKFRPPMFMPRWASRLTLIVTDVRVQRLQEISEEDAIAEGCRPFFDEENPRKHIGPNGTVHKMAPLRGPVDDFHRLWDSLNADRGYGWDVHPWVCAVSFTVHRMNIDQMEAA